MTDIEKLEMLFLVTVKDIEDYRAKHNEVNDEIYWTTYANGIVACIALLRNDNSVGKEETMNYLCEKYKLFHCAPHDEETVKICATSNT